jgi:hypothetical protein
VEEVMTNWGKGAGMVIGAKKEMENVSLKNWIEVGDESTPRMGKG